MKSLQQYSTFKLSIVSLLICFCITLANYLLATGLKTMPTSLYLHEHKQLINDWTSLPFVDIVLESEANDCPTNYEPLVYRVWNGTYDLCEVTADGKQDNYEVLKNSDATCNGLTKQGLAPMNMTNISGMKLCGKRGGNSFIDEVRVEPFTRKCPKNYEPCSPNTDATDTICVDASSGPNYKEKCPILDIVFIER